MHVVNVYKIIMSLLRWLYVTVQTSRQHYTGSYSSTAFHNNASDTEVSSYFVYNHDVDIVDVRRHTRLIQQV